MGTKDVYNYAKKGAIDFKNTPGHIQFNMQLHRKKVLFIKKAQDLNNFFGYIFFRTLIPVILFDETLLAAPKLF